MEATIRKMTLSDIDDVHKIEVLSFPNTSWDKSSFEKELTNNNYAHYFVLENEGIIGYIGIWIVFESSQITTIAMDSKFRGQGYGEMLMTFAKTYCLKQSCHTMSLEVSVTNTKAINLYEKMNFKYGGIRKDYYGKGLDAHVMWVNLNE